MGDENAFTKDLSNKTRLPGTFDEKNVIQSFKAQFENFTSLKTIKRFPKQADALIIGGGIIGSFAAYWIKKIKSSLSVVVIERDDTYTQSSTFWSVGGFRQQFSLPENIEMSMFGVEFLRNAQENLFCGKNEKVDLEFNQDGYLFLASKKTAEILAKNHRIQLNKDAKVRLYNKEELKSTFRWINPDDVELASFGYMNEGWVDTRKYLLAVRKAAMYHGAEFVKGELTSFEKKAENEAFRNNTSSFKNINVALIDLLSDKYLPIDFRFVINAAGPWASNVARIAGIGGKIDEEKSLAYAVSLPVEARKRYIYMFYAENGPILNVPLTIDHSGVFFKRHGLSNYYICGLNQNELNEPTNMDLNHIDYNYFEESIKPVLLKRCPSFQNLKLVNAWAGYYEYNTLDQNLIIGQHPFMENFIFANGSSGHGLQHAAAIGRALAEIVVFGTYKTIDLSRFGFKRVLDDSPLKEIDVV